MTSSRRRFLAEAAALAVAGGLPAGAGGLLTASKQPIVDAHIHLFDPARPGGIPWPEASDTVLYRPALPERYSALARPEGVLAAIAIEASPLLADNDWLLETAARSDLIVGVIGDLDPAVREFPAQLERLAANPLFRGIRYGNLWKRDLGDHLDDPLFLANVRELARRGLVLESANPTPKLVADLLRLARTIPEVRIVMDHLPQAVPPEDVAQRALYLATLKELSEMPHVFVKGSEIPRRIGGRVPLELAVYTPWLDTLWGLFGEDRIFFGSDWPNSDQLTPVGAVFALARGYMATKSRVARFKFFWGNSVRVYGWKARNAAQRAVVG